MVDCLDLADSKFHIVGKFLYEVLWYPPNQYGKMYERPRNNQLNQSEPGMVYPNLNNSYNAGVNPYYRASSVGRETNLYAKQIGN